MKEKKQTQAIPFDLACHKFNIGITELINNSGLPPTAVYYILKDNLYEVERVRQQVRLDQEYQMLDVNGTGERDFTVEGDIEGIDEYMQNHKMELIKEDTNGDS